MAFTPDRFERLQRSLDLALNQEWPKIGATTRRISTLRTTPITPAASVSGRTAIATVATDGGENKLKLEPVQLQIVRVADSLGTIYFEEFIPESLDPEEILRFFFKSDERLQRFMRYVELDWDELLPRTDLQRSHLLSMMRELMEWAALLKLASQPGPKLLIRDGLLRSILLSQAVFARLRAKFQELTDKRGHLLVGVAKRSRVINYLSVAFGLEQTFRDHSPAFVRIPAELERQASPAQYRWIGDRAMGSLNVARLDLGETAPLVPVDVADWQQTRAAEAMQQLHECSRCSFPMRGYPQPLIQAHEHACLGGLEIEILESLLLQQIRERDPAAASVALELRLAGQQLTGSTPANNEDEK
jgi:hypothetical protein